MTQIIYQWIDFLWLPIGFFTVHKSQRLMTLAFIFTCLITFRTQVELIESTGFETGFLGIMHSSLHSRGIIVYSIIIMLFLILAYLSPQTKGVIFFAATISIYLLAFCMSMLLMAL
jgi:hypothetical protein